MVYASPNALSVYRKLGLAGDLAGHLLTDLTRDLVPPSKRPDEETLSAVLGARDHRDTEIGSGDVALIVRAIPLRPDGEHIGGLILLRDVTDLRRRDRELITKDATIREIHHRVKNNLQTVAALLRLQARRIDSAEATAALEEAVRRVGSIAIVHETLSQAVEETVDFDEIADRLARLVTDVGLAPVRVRREGRFGMLVSEQATPLAMVRDRAAPERRRARLSATGRRPPRDADGEIVLVAQRRGGQLEVSIVDDGRGLPRASTSTGAEPGVVDREDAGRVGARRSSHAGRITRVAEPAPISRYPLD